MSALYAHAVVPAEAGISGGSCGHFVASPPEIPAYEPPEDPEIRIDTTVLSPGQAVDEIIQWLVGEG